MKRDMDLARQILLRMWEAPTFLSSISLEFDGYTPEEVSYHVMLLDQAGLITATDMSAGSDLVWFPQLLTWGGQEFLDAARDPGIWAHAQAAAAMIGGVSFQLLMPLLIELAKAKMKTAGLLP